MMLTANVSDVKIKGEAQDDCSTLSDEDLLPLVHAEDVLRMGQSMQCSTFSI